MAVDITDATFENDVLNSEGVVLVDFWAPWCGPCHMLSPILEEIGDEMGEKVKIMKVNVDENQDTSIKYQIMSIPTVIVFKDGKPMKSFIGVQPKQEYVSAINEASAA